MWVIDAMVENPPFLPFSMREIDYFFFKFSSARIEMTVMAIETSCVHGIVPPFMVFAELCGASAFLDTKKWVGKFSSDILKTRNEL